MDPGTATCEKIALSKKQQKTSRQQVIRITKIVSNWGPGGRPNCGQSSICSRLFPSWARNGPRSRPGVAQGVQKVPKGFQKVAKRHKKDIQKATTRHPNAISKCIGNSIHNSRSNAIANAIANAIDNRRPLHTLM